MLIGSVFTFLRRQKKTIVDLTMDQNKLIVVNVTLIIPSVDPYHLLGRTFKYSVLCNLLWNLGLPTLLLYGRSDWIWTSDPYHPKIIDKTIANVKPPTLEKNLPVFMKVSFFDTT